MIVFLEQMKKLLKVNNRNRRAWYRCISLFSAYVVVFVTTYALILPAITMEKRAACGIEEHQHDESCYEYQLTCDQEESDGHHHDDSCYSVSQELACDMEEHTHSQEDGCFDEEGNLTCTITEHAHDDSCYREEKALTCEQEESDGHHHTDACYEQVLICGKEVHTHSVECYEDAQEEIEENIDQDDNSSVSSTVTREEEEQSFTSGTLIAEGDGYRIIMDYPEEARIPENAELSVREITASTDRSAFKDCIEQAEQHLAESADGKSSVDSEASRFWDIEILAEETEGNAASGGAAAGGPATKRSIHPAAPVKVSIQILDTPAADASAGSESEKAQVEDPAVLHYGEDGVEQLEAVTGEDAVKEREAESTAEAVEEIEALENAEADEAIETKEIRFEAESFSIYGLVYTVESEYSKDSLITVKATDAQISSHYISDKGDLYEVTVTYGEDAGIPEGSRVKVTEFSEGSEEYAYARKSVLADKKSRGEEVDLNTFGFAALDISIIDPDGKEIEPEASVQVDLQIKSLPGVDELNEVTDTLAVQHHVEVEDGVVVETVYDGSAEPSFKLETNETVAAEGVAVDPESVKEEDFATPEPVEMETEGLNVEFDAAAFSTFTISWNYAYGNGVKVHYVDENGNELTVKNSKFITTLTGSSTTPAYLIYDIDGYEYERTYRKYYSYRKWYTEDIAPELWRHNASYYGDWNGWMYTTDGEILTALNSGDSNNEIYVVYKKKGDVAEGGTPKVTPSGSTTPVAPRINKESTPNGDDTNTLALSLISDTAKLEVEKLADVIVVFDVSGSMVQNNLGNVTRLQAAKDAVNLLAEHLSTKVNAQGKPLVRMSLIQFSTKASAVKGMTELTTSGSSSGLNQIKRAVNVLTADGGTNWDHALQLANEENDLDKDRATFVIFVTDGDPTFRNTRMDVTDLDLQGETNDYAWDTYRELHPNPYYNSNSVYGPADNDKTGQCYAAAVEQGKAIVAAGKNIYTIGISKDVKKVESFNSDIKGNGAYLASDTSGLQQAFADIEASISGASGWGNIKMTDGITNLTNTVQKTGLTNVGGDFTYWKAPAPANWKDMTEAQKKAYKPKADDFAEWDPKSEGAELAKYNKTTGAVEWNMGSTFMPEAGVTYQVRFKVWPSQEAYDYIAKLNNGTIQYDTLPADVQAQIIKNGNTYTLKTNKPDANTTYQSAVKTGNTVSVSGDPKKLDFPKVEDLKLSVDKMTVKKEWKNSLDPDSRWKSAVKMLLTDSEGNLYKEIDLNEDNKYTAKDNFISCGLAKIENGELIIYEKGHDFKLSEPEDYAYYWELDAQTYRPMIINAQLNMLVKTDAPAGMGDHTYYEEKGIKYYKIDGGTYKAISTGDSAATLTATNIRRSNLNLTKKVIDENGNSVITSDMFTFEITVNDVHGEDVWFSVQTDAKDPTTVVKDITTDATPEVKDGQKTGSYHAKSGDKITVSIEPGWNLRFMNLPNGTTYTIKEILKENYTFIDATIDNDGTFTVDKETATGSGKIDKSDTQYTVAYTNKTVPQQVYIKKTTQDTQTPLKGAVFSLYTKAGYEAEPRKALKTGLESDQDGKIDLGKLGVGQYYLVETSAPAGYILLADPVEINITATEVTYKQTGNATSMSNEGVSFDSATQTYTLTVTNNAGQKLPSTGGPGTQLFTILGSVLTFVAGSLLWRRWKLI